MKSEEEYIDYSCSTPLERLSRDVETLLRSWHIVEGSDRHVSFQRTASGQNSFSYRAAKLWNDQNTEAKNAKSFAQFKKLLKNDRS